MWLFLVIVGFVFIFLLKRGVNCKLLVYSMILGAAVFALSYFYLQLALKACLYMGVVTIFIWYLMFNIFYKIVKRQ